VSLRRKAKCLAGCNANIVILDVICRLARKYFQTLGGTKENIKRYLFDVLISKVRKLLTKHLLIWQGDILINGAGGNNPKATNEREVPFRYSC